MSVFAELRRRNVIRVGTAYLVLAWLVIQVTDTVAPALKLPEWILSAVVWIGIVGFPFALLFAWIFELTPDGIVREEQVDRTVSITGSTGRKLDRLIIALLAVVVSLLVVDEYILSDRSSPAADSGSESQNRELRDYSSIAVLPFVNMSSDPEQEYFSDGISEELLNLLARINGLKVAARTSSFAFRGKELDVREIGTTLNVQTVLEGSVRKSGSQIRVTAQLISASDGYHLWSDTYDRELTDIFQIQDEISDSIVSALRSHLDPGFEGVKVNRTESLEAYDLYLQGRHHLRRGYPRDIEQAHDFFRRATEVDPQYAPAWAARALAEINLRETPFWKGIPASEALELARTHIEKALSLNPDLPEAHVALGVLYWDLYEFDQALASVDRALSINFSLASAHEERGRVLESLWRISEARASYLTGADLDPLDMSILSRAVGLAETYKDPGLLEEVVRRLQRQPTAEAKELLRYAELVRFSQSESNHAVVYQRYAAEANATPADSPLKARLDRAREREAARLLMPGSLLNTGRNREFLELMWILGLAGEEARALAGYEKLPSQLKSIPILLEEMSILYMRQGDCETGMEFLQKAHGDAVPLYGQTIPNMTRSNANLAANRVYCLRQLDRAAEAEDILHRLNPLVETLKQSAHGGYELLDIKTEILAGNQDAAMALLETAVKSRDLGWWVWIDPVVITLADQPGYGQLRQWLKDTVNSERAEIGQPPFG